MKNNLKGIPLVLGIMMALVFAYSPILSNAIAAELPKTMLWSCYDVGASGYIQASSIADAFVKKYGTRVRLTPSGTSVGRLIPVVMKKVDYGFLANELFAAVEGIYEFASAEWGPQDLQVILAHPTSIGLSTTEDSGIKTLADMKGKRWATFPSATALIKENAYIAYLGLTRKDFQWVIFPNYKAHCDSLKEGKADIAGPSYTAAICYELMSSPKGFRILQFDPNNKAAIARMQQVAPFFSIGKETIGAGLSEKNFVWTPIYRYPIITCRTDADPEAVYTFIKALDDSFPMYKDAYPPNFLWDIKEAGVPPADAPFHPGAIRYLKEKSVWKPEHDEWNKNRIAHVEKVKGIWKKAVAIAKDKKISGEDFTKFWLDYREKALQ